MGCFLPTFNDLLLGWIYEAIKQYHLNSPEQPQQPDILIQLGCKFSLQEVEKVAPDTPTKPLQTPRSQGKRVVFPHCFGGRFFQEIWIFHSRDFRRFFPPWGISLPEYGSLQFYNGRKKGMNNYPVFLGGI